MNSQTIGVDDLEALQRTCDAEAARIHTARIFLTDADADGHANDDLTPEEMIAVARELDDPDLLGRPALLRWNNIMREARPFDTGA